MKLQSLLVTLCIALLAVPVPHAVSAQEDKGSFVLSVLRRDGIVIPFATFDGRRWSERWPEGLPSERPISLDDIPGRWWGIEPAPRRMRQWSEGAPLGEVTLTAPLVVPLMCAPRTALRSDYKSSQPVPPGFVLPYPKDGLLVAGDATLSRIDVVDPASAEATGVLRLAIDEFNKQETAAASAFSAWRHPIKANDRKKVPVTLEAIYRAPADEPGWTAYFIETVRQYPPGKDEQDGCGLATFASGWVVTGPDRATIRVGARITYCDRKGVGYMLPFGVVRADEKNYWVFQYAGFEIESYQVMRPHRRGADPAVIYTAGVCGR